MDYGLILYTLAMFGGTILLIKLGRTESSKISRILTDRGETLSLDKNVSDPHTNIDFGYTGRSNIYSYIVSGKTYTYETKLVLPFTFGKQSVKILYEKKHPENAVVDSWIEMYALPIFVAIWTVATVLSTLAIWIFIGPKK